VCTCICPSFTVLAVAVPLRALLRHSQEHSSSVHLFWSDMTFAVDSKERTASLRGGSMSMSVDGCCLDQLPPFLSLPVGLSGVLAADADLEGAGGVFA